MQEYTDGTQNVLAHTNELTKWEYTMKHFIDIMRAAIITEIFCCSTACIIDRPIMLNLCGTVWETKEDTLGHMTIAFECYEEGRFLILTNSQGDAYTGFWNEAINTGCTYSLDLVTRLTTTKEEIMLISGEITTWSRKTDIMTITYITHSNPTTLQKTTFIRIKE